MADGHPRIRALEGNEYMRENQALETCPSSGKGKLYIVYLVQAKRKYYILQRSLFPFISSLNPQLRVPRLFNLSTEYKRK